MRAVLIILLTMFHAETYALSETGVRLSAALTFAKQSAVDNAQNNSSVSTENSISYLAELYYDSYNTRYLFSYKQYDMDLDVEPGVSAELNPYTSRQYYFTYRKSYPFFFFGASIVMEQDHMTLFNNNNIRDYDYEQMGLGVHLGINAWMGANSGIRLQLNYANFISAGEIDNAEIQQADKYGLRIELFNYSRFLFVELQQKENQFETWEHSQTLMESGIGFEF